MQEVADIPDDIADIAELVLDAVFGARKALREIDNDIVALMRQAHEGQPLTGSVISTDGIAPETLCCPLTKRQLLDIRSCTGVKKHHLSFDIARAKGIRSRHIVVLVTVSFEGVTGTGTPVSIHIDRVPVHVTIGRGHPRRIEEIAAYPMD